ncbi:ABC transporter permease subunit [Halovivax limisalsi]|uniref:ABC transporter permease subunit n=1 Tax=Halovivax limisalsi TaxID=1453760 RepID=UPI001FFCAA89|nr:ABC transporter permease subunit [Halovivax limisalsi]
MTATWRKVARKDVEDGVRSKVFWGITGTFVAFVVTSLLAAEELVRGAETVTPEIALAGVAMLAQLFVPGVALVAGYTAVTGELRSGSLRVLLGFPFTRGAIVGGKLVGRAALTLAGLAVGLGVSAALVVGLYGVPPLGRTVGFVAATALLGVVFTALAVGGSALASTRGRAMSLTVTPFVAAVFFWKPAVVGLYYAVSGTLPGVEVTRWYLFLIRLNPLEAYRVLAGRVLDEPVQAVPYLPLEDLPTGAVAARYGAEARLAGEVPWYLGDWMAIAVLLAWGLLPLAIGYRSFARRDLG